MPSFNRGKTGSLNVQES